MTTITEDELRTLKKIAAEEEVSYKHICHGSRFQSILVTFFLIFGGFKFSKIDIYF